MNKLIFRLVEFAHRRAWLVIGATIVITVVLGTFAVQIKVSPDTASILPEDPRIKRLVAKYGSEDAETDILIILASAADLFSVRKLTALEAVYEQIEKIPTVRSGLTAFNFPTVLKDGKRLAIATMAVGRRAPQTDEELAGFMERLFSDPQARNFVISADGTTLCAVFVTDLQDDYRPLVAAAERAIEPLKKQMDIRVSGAMPVSATVMNSIYVDLPLFFLLSLLIILVSYYLSFRTLRSLLLPVAVVGLGSIWAVGIMRLLGFKFTIITIMAPPLILTLGSAYSLHVLNQYYRESKPTAGDKHWIVNAVGHINTTIFLASVTDVFGFASLITVSLRQLREFGLATSVGITSCALLALLFLPAVLSLLAAPTEKQRTRVTKGLLSRFSGRLARVVIRLRWPILAIAAGVCIAFGLSLRSVHFETDVLKYFRHHERSVEDNLFLIEKFGGFVPVNLSLSAPDDQPNYFLNPAVLRRVSRFEDELAADKDICYISSFNAYLKSMNRTMTGSSQIPEQRPLILLLSRYFSVLSATPLGKGISDILMNKDFSRYTLVLRVYDSKNKSLALETDLREIFGRIQETAQQLLPPEINTELWGNTVSMLYLSETLTNNLLRSIAISIIPVFLVAALVFWSIKHGLLILVPLSFGIMLNYIVMWIFSIPLDAVTITFSSIAIGIGVDEAIHLMVVYRRLKVYHKPEITVEQALRSAGRPMVLTTISLAVALLVFLFSNFRPVVFFGILISLALVMTTVGAMVVLPALLYFDARHRSRMEAGGLSAEAPEL